MRPVLIAVLWMLACPWLPAAGNEPGRLVVTVETTDGREVRRASITLTNKLFTRSVTVDGRLEGWRRTAHPNAGRKAVRGLADDEPRATLDLHGATLEEGRRQVLAFVRRRRARGETVVRIVVGKGRHSEGGIGVLREAIGGWLATPPAAHHVRAFVSASPRNGGTGAVMIRLQSPALGKDSQ